MLNKYKISDAFFVFKTPTCVWCERSINLIRSSFDDVDVVAIDITTDDDARKFIVETHGLKTVPQIWYNNEYIGGHDSLVKWVNSRKDD